jgi:hypothetical protein
VHELLALRDFYVSATRRFFDFRYLPSRITVIPA